MKFISLHALNMMNENIIECGIAINRSAISDNNPFGIFHVMRMQWPED